MRLNLGHRVQPAHDGENHPHHVNHHRIERFEGAADLLVVGLIILFGVAMVIGLITASGNVTW
jgi:hypothetical protein